MRKNKSKITLLTLVAVVLLLATLACAESIPEVKAPGDVSVSESSSETTDTEVSENPVGSVRSNPAPFGYAVTMGDMTYTVTEIVRPADEIVESGNMFNTMPDEGKEYLFANLSVTCNKGTDDSCSISDFEFEAVDSSGNVIELKWFLTGVPDLFEDGEFFGGVTKTGYLPFIVEIDETGLILIYEELLGNPVYLSLEPVVSE